MKEGGTLLKQGSKWSVKDGKSYDVSEDIVIPSADFHQAPVEYYALDGSGKFVIRLTVLDLDDNPVEFKAKPKREGSSQAGRPLRRDGYSNQSQDRNQQSLRDKAKHHDRQVAENQERYENPAFAPYNFVPLNATIVPAPSGPRTCSGYLELVITALTPFFIGNQNPSQQDTRNRNLSKPFFQMLDGPLVPGSALRGVTRTIVEIVSWSALDVAFFTDKTLSYRAVAERVGRQRDAYRQIIPANREEKDIKAGYLKYDRQTKEYFIHVASQVERFDSTEDAREPEWLGTTCFVRSGKMPPNPRTGEGGKKRQWKLSAASGRKPLTVPAAVYKVYRDDATRQKLFGPRRKTRVDVFEAAKSAEGDVARFGYPVFFNTDASGEVVLSIGHTAYYRVPYTQSIGQHIQQTPSGEGEDFAHSIFGSTLRAGRVWFEDCRPVPSTVQTLPAAYTQLLMGPKPTSFQHYLCQPHGILTPMNELLHWGDKDIAIRGHKLFWHRITPSQPGTYSWSMERMDESEDRGTDQAKIQPLRPGAQFRGRIRFDQLTAEELGALLFALELPEGMAHKLGFAKPLGLGSVRISVGLVNIDRTERYGKLLDAHSNWNTGSQQGETGGFKVAFAKAVAQALGIEVDGWEGLWQHARLREMAALMAFDPTQHAEDGWLEATRYMRNKAGRPGQQHDKNEYAKRPVLPQAGEVVERYLGKKKAKKAHE